MKITGLLAIVLGAVVGVHAQDGAGGRKIYSDNADSVLFLLVQSPDGEFVAQGTGFVISGQRIVTNAHVANAGKIFVELGPARVPAHVEKIDSFNDLAVLRVDIELTVRPLKLAQQAPAPGETIFAIGNPQGLTKTISQGLVSGVRDIDGRKMLQVTTALSHGSSGEPIFNSAGDVVGVAAGSLTSGQNLNFAVPIALLSKLLSNPRSPSNAIATLDEIAKVEDAQKQETFSADADSPWQTLQSRINTLLESAFTEAGANASALIQISEVAMRESNFDIAIQAATRSEEITRTPQAMLALAKSLNAKGVWQQSDERSKLQSRAETEAREAISAARPVTADMYYTLADILENEGVYLEAEKNFRFALSGSQKESNSDLYANSLRGLARCASNLNQQTEAEQWFDQLKATGALTWWDWRTQAVRLGQADKFEQAADAYSAAAQLGGGYDNWCNAADYYAMAPSRTDIQESILSAARTCIQQGIGEKESDKNLASAHLQIAEVLNARGVYSEALSQAKEASVLDSQNPFFFDSMARALVGLRRFQEAIVAEQQAIRISDGKYAWMHLTLGSAYFSAENWPLALQSYQKASELNPKDPTAAYNAALCNQRMSYFRDAVQWYEEYLRRAPDAKDRADVVDQIIKLKTLYQ